MKNGAQPTQHLSGFAKGEPSLPRCREGQDSLFCDSALSRAPSLLATRSDSLVSRGFGE